MIAWLDEMMKWLAVGALGSEAQMPEPPMNEPQSNDAATAPTGDAREAEAKTQVH